MRKRMDNTEKPKGVKKAVWEMRTYIYPKFVKIRKSPKANFIEFLKNYESAEV